MISLIVPVYNMESLLDRCISSLLIQQGNYEIILVDDGSTDRSGAMCDRYAEQFPNCVQVVHKSNGGLSSARNAGMDSAKGDFVIFPDPDDWVESNYVSRISEIQQNYFPDLVCVGYFVDYDDRCFDANLGKTLSVMDGAEARRALIGKPNMSGFAWNKLYRLDIIQKYGLRFLDDVGTTEDMDFAFRYLKYCKKVVFSPEDRLYHYYQRPGAATHSGFSKKKLHAINTYIKMLEDTDNKEFIHEIREEICNTAINLICLYQNSNANDQESWKRIRWYLSENLGYYCRSERYGLGRKVQAILAYFAPKLYLLLKNRVTNED